MYINKNTIVLYVRMYLNKNTIQFLLYVSIHTLTMYIEWTLNMRVPYIQYSAFITQFIFSKIFTNDTP